MIGTAPLPTFDTRASILAALERAGWQIDADEPHVMEASDGERYGVAVFFEWVVPVEICYGDGELICSTAKTGQRLRESSHPRRSRGCSATRKESRDD